MPDTKICRVIHSREEFLTEVCKGDTFWYMTSHNFRPYTIEGPFEILDFVEMGNEKFQNVKCHITRGRVQMIEYHSINDMTNEYHGVFTDEEEAWAYFKEKRAAFDARERSKKA